MSDVSQQLIDQVKTAIADKTSVRIQGGGTKSGLGRAVDSTTQLISTSEHSGVVQYKPVELIMTVRGGTTLAEIDSELAKNKQMLACDPRRFGGQATIAGSLAANQSGHARPWFGSLRDHVLGIKLINGQAEHCRFGGQVMKNVAGYDVARLQAGAMGAFGLISEVSFKVLPKPEMCVSMSLETGASEAIALMNKLSGTSKPITAVSWVDGTVYFRLEGPSKAVEATTKQWQSKHGLAILDDSTASILWESLREHEHDFFAGTEKEKSLWKFSVNAAADHISQDAAWAFDWCGSQRWLVGEFSLEELAEHAYKMGGEVQLYSGGDRQQELSIPRSAAVKQLMQNLKNSFDPENIFNSGRLYSWL